MLQSNNTNHETYDDINIKKKQGSNEMDEFNLAHQNEYFLNNEINA